MRAVNWLRASWSSEQSWKFFSQEKLSVPPTCQDLKVKTGCGRWLVVSTSGARRGPSGGALPSRASVLVWLLSDVFAAFFPQKFAASPQAPPGWGEREQCPSCAHQARERRVRSCARLWHHLKGTCSLMLLAWLLFGKLRMASLSNLRAL